MSPQTVRTHINVSSTGSRPRPGSQLSGASYVAELTTPTYTFVGGEFQLEEKRLGRSPHLADALR